MKVECGLCDNTAEVELNEDGYPDGEYLSEDMGGGWTWYCNERCLETDQAILALDA